MNKNIIFFDVETNGVRGSSVLSISAIKVNYDFDYNKWTKVAEYDRFYFRNEGEKITMQFVERMAKMEEKLDMLVRMIPEITALQIAQARSEQVAESAHNRIDNIYKVAGLISTIISVVIALIGRAV